MKRLLLALALLAGSAHASTTLYYCDCQAGADGACVAGADGNAGTVSSSPKQNLPSQATFEGMGAGDQKLFCKGGSWIKATGPAIDFGSTSGPTAASPATIGAYTPSWGPGTAKPLITVQGTAGDADCIRLFSGGLSTKQGLVFSGLNCVGPGITSTANGFETYNGAADIILDNMTLDGFAIGVLVQAGGAASTASTRITLRNSTVKNNKTQGFFGGGPATLIENNTFTNNGWYGPTLNQNHNLYMAVPAAQSYHLTGAVVRGNTLTKSALCDVNTSGGCSNVGTCQGTSLVMHQTTNDAVVENNTIDETTGAGAGCYGIQIAPGNGGVVEGYYGTIVRGNKVIGVGGNGIDIGACLNCTVENNDVEWPADPGFQITGIRMPDARGAEDATDTAMTVRNNTVYLSGANTGNVGIRVESLGTNHRVTSNAIYHDSTTSASAKCFSTTGLTISEFTAFDYNICARDTAVPVYGTSGATPSGGFDTHGQLLARTVAQMFTQAPASGNSYALTPAAGSPQLNAADTTVKNFALLGYRGAVPAGVRSAGAEERSPSATAPSSPTPTN